MLSQEEVLKRFREVHGDRYDYKLVIFINSKTKVKIICRKHGIFEQRVHKHFAGRGCKHCAIEKNTLRCTSTTEEFIEKAMVIHGYNYDYQNVEYIKNDIDVEIICEKHGLFLQQPNNHLQGKGCELCGNERSARIRCMPIEEFKQLGNSIHNFKYKYHKVIYVNNYTKVEIICPIHGSFWQTPSHHIHSKNGCNDCGNITQGLKRRLSTDEFIERALVIHGDKYSYRNSKYLVANEPIEIICPDHGSFWQIAYSHLIGHGCSSCNDSKKSLIVYEYLLNNNINIIKEHRYDDCRYKYTLPFDFYLPDYNILIEYDGSQHYNYSPTWFHRNGYWEFEEQVEKDRIKTEYAKDNNIPLIRVRYDVDNIEDYLENKLKEIINN